MRSWIILTVTLLSSCAQPKDSGKKKEEKKPASEAGAQADAAGRLAPGFLTLNDLKNPGSLKPYTAEELVAEVNSDRTFFNHTPKALEDDDTNCIMRTHEASKVHATKNTVELNFDTDLSSCAQQEAKAPSGYTVNVDEYKVHMMIGITCEGVDMTSADGMTVKAFNDKYGDTDSCAVGVTSGTYFMNAKISIKESFKDAAGKVAATVEFLSTSATVDGNGGPCQLQVAGDLHAADGCTSYNISIDRSTGAKGNTYTRQDYQNLKGAVHETYYRSGAFKLTYNDWTGEVRYGGANKAPDWTLSSGSKKTGGTFAYKKKDSTEESSGDDASAGSDATSEENSTGLSLTGIAVIPSAQRAQDLLRCPTRP